MKLVAIGEDGTILGEAEEAAAARAERGPRRLVMVEVAEDGSVLSEGAEAGSAGARRGARAMKVVAVSAGGVIMEEDAEGALAAARRGVAQLMVAAVGADGGVLAESVEAAAGLSRRGARALQVVEVAAGSTPGEGDEAGGAFRRLGGIGGAPLGSFTVEEDLEGCRPPMLKLQRTASFPGADPPPLPSDPSLQPQQSGQGFLSGLELSLATHSVVGSGQPAPSHSTPPTTAPTQPAAEQYMAQAAVGTDVALGMQREALRTAATAAVTAATAASDNAAAPHGGAPSVELGAAMPPQVSWASEQHAPVRGEMLAPRGGGAAAGSVNTTHVGGVALYALSADEALRRKQELLETAAPLPPMSAVNAAARDAAVDELSLRFGRTELPTSDHRTAALEEGKLLAALVPQDHSATFVGMDCPIDDAEQVALVKYLNRALEGDEHLATTLPLVPGGNALFEAAAPGVLLAKFVAHVDPEALDTRALNRPDAAGLLSDGARLQNHTLCANAATAMGCGVAGLQSEQMLDAAQHGQPVLELVWNLTREKLTGRLTPRHTPELLQLLDDHEAAAVAGGRHPVGTNELMVRWINHHIASYVHEHPDQQEVPRGYAVRNLHTDLADSTALTIVLHQLAPDQACTLGMHHTTHRAMHHTHAMHHASTVSCAGRPLRARLQVA